MAKINHECPLCGRTIEEDDDLLCSECRNSVENQYKSDLFSENDPVTLEDNSNIPVNFNSSTKKKKSKSIIIFISVCILVTIFGIIASMNVSYLREDHVAEDIYWEKCLSTNTVLAYSKYLVAYPSGKYVDEANHHIQDLRDNVYFEWSQLKKESDINDILFYIKNNPDSKYIDSAKYLADSISWTNALNVDNIEAISTYILSIRLGTIPGFYKDLAEDRYDYLLSVKQLDSITLPPIRDFITSLYVYFTNNDTTSLKDFFLKDVIFNTDSIDRSELLISFLTRQQDRDSIKNYIPDMSSFNGSIDRDSTIFLSYIELKSVVPKSKNIKKKGKPKATSILYKDSVLLILKKPKQISSILFKDAN